MGTWRQEHTWAWTELFEPTRSADSMEKVKAARDSARADSLKARHDRQARFGHQGAQRFAGQGTGL
jgi:hypothetical protein